MGFFSNDKLLYLRVPTFCANRFGNKSSSQDSREVGKRSTNNLCRDVVNGKS